MRNIYKAEISECKRILNQRGWGLCINDQQIVLRRNIDSVWKNAIHEVIVDVKYSRDNEDRFDNGPCYTLKSTLFYSDTRRDINSSYPIESTDIEAIGKISIALAWDLIHENKFDFLEEGSV